VEESGGFSVDEMNKARCHMRKMIAAGVGR